MPSRTVTDGADCDVLQTTADSVPGIGLGVKITLYFSDVENVASINVSDVVNVGVVNYMFLRCGRPLGFNASLYLRCGGP